MKARFSEYLNSLVPGLRKLIDILSKDYDYVSVLATDSKGLAVGISQHAKSMSNQTMSTERGTVVRVYKDKLYSEYALNEFDPSAPEAAAAEITSVVEDQFAVMKESGAAAYETEMLPDVPLELFVEKETEQLPEDCRLSDIVEMLSGISAKGMTISEYVLDCMISVKSTHICKLFLTKNRYLRQSYVCSDGVVAVIVGKDGQNKAGYKTISGLGGPEIFCELEEKLQPAFDNPVDFLSAERIAPGEYEIITAPEISGLFAHEAFGHGVEMDMFVKGRALGADYIGKRVGSDLVTMHEGALCVENVSSYAFDDEGTLAGDVTEIDHGILKTGICDALAALRLGVLPTGNGKRENFEHKVYTRMTNTIFDSGTDTLEDMIKSVKFGYLLEQTKSGMEDPKHWGIQCVIQIGREIKDGKLTGKVVSPIVLTGYVPDLLGNITMASPDREVFGSGGCGKGHKESVQVSLGGPYLKTVGRLG